MASLRRHLIAWVVPPLLIVGAAAAGGGFVFMERRLTAAFDADLGEIARALLPYVHLQEGRVTLAFTRQADAVLRADSVDQVYYTVFDAQGRTAAGDTSLPKPPETPENVPVFWDDVREGRPIRAAALRVMVEGEPVVVMAAETTRKRETATREALFSALVPVGLLTLAALLGILFGVRRGLAPLERLREELQTRSHLHLGAVAETPIDELKPVLRELNEMLARLDQAQQVQARFVANAAHQLRTPVAGVVAQLELARAGGSDARQHVELARQGAARLGRLTRQLLTLAAADPISNPRSQDDDCDLDAIAGVLAPEWLRAAEARGVEIAFELAGVPIRGNSLLLGELASNLVDNATRHAASAVRVVTGATADACVLEVIDDGPGIPLAERAAVFERFRRLDSQSTERSGLGLAIVKEIADRHGAAIEVGEGEGGRGTRVRVAFPRTAR